MDGYVAEGSPRQLVGWRQAQGSGTGCHCGKAEDKGWRGPGVGPIGLPCRPTDPFSLTPSSNREVCPVHRPSGHFPGRRKKFIRPSQAGARSVSVAACASIASAKKGRVLGGGECTCSSNTSLVFCACRGSPASFVLGRTFGKKAACMLGLVRVTTSHD